MKPAWNNDATSRSSALLRLTTAFENDSISRNNTPFSIMMQGEAPREAESILALPVPVAFLVDGVFSELPSGWGPEWGVETCQAMRANCNLYTVVGGVMHQALTIVRKMISDRVERGDVAGAKVYAQLDVLDEVIDISNRSAGGQVFDGTEPEVLSILRLSSHDDVNYICREALEAIVQRIVPDQKSMLDADKTKNQQLRLANSQSAGMSALSALRAVAQMVMEDARHTARASDGTNATTRLTEENARVLFFDGIAKSILHQVKEAPAYKRPLFAWGKNGKGSSGQADVRKLVPSAKTQTEAAAVGDGVRD